MNRVAEECNSELREGFRAPTVKEILEDLEIAPNSLEDQQELENIVTELLHYPSDQLAELHRQANRLGCLDQKSNRVHYRASVQKGGFNQAICECCCKPRQDSLPFATPLQNVSYIGEATLLFFEDLRLSFYLMLMTFVVYSLYAMMTNYQNSTSARDENCPLFSKCGVSSLALGGKLTQNLKILDVKYVRQCWVGLGLMVAWFVFFIIKKILIFKLSEHQDNEEVTARDFSVMIHNLPRSYTREALQQKLNFYAEDMRDKLIYPSNYHELKNDAKYMGDFKIARFNCIRDYYRVVDMQKKADSNNIADLIRAKKAQLLRWLEHRRTHVNFPVDTQQRQDLYHQIKALQTEMDAMRKVQRVQQTSQYDLTETREIEGTQTAFISFQHTHAKINLCNLNQQQRSWYWRACFCLFCCCCRMFTPPRRSTRLDINDDLVVSSAPEPEEIIWEKAGAPQFLRIWRRVLTYSVTFLILVFSFAGNYVLEYFESVSDNTFIGFLIPLYTLFVNSALEWAIYRLTDLEMDFLHSRKQVSLGMKITTAKFMNGTLMLLLVDYFVKNDLYSEKGLVKDVVVLSIVSMVIQPLQKMIPPFRIFKKYRKWRLQRNPLLKLHYPSQIEYNKEWEEEEFNVGKEYAYILNLILFTGFYVSLQPVIAVFSAANALFMYFAMKYKLFYKSARPRPISNVVTIRMTRIMYMGMFAFALGHVTWGYILPQRKIQDCLIPNFICAGLGGLAFLIPIIGEIYKQKLPQQPMIYERQRTTLFMEYQRLNPITKNEAEAELKKYIAQLKLRSAQPSEASQEQRETEKAAKAAGAVDASSPDTDNRKTMIGQSKIRMLQGDPIIRISTELGMESPATDVRLVTYGNREPAYLRPPSPIE